jgi:hypothetical protein
MDRRQIVELRAGSGLLDLHAVDSVDAVQDDRLVRILIRTGSLAVAVLAAGPGDSLEVIAGAQPVPAQARGGHIHVIPTPPVPGGADERLAPASVEDSGHQDRLGVMVPARSWPGRLVLDGDGCHRTFLSGDSWIQARQKKPQHTDQKAP